MVGVVIFGGLTIGFIIIEAVETSAKVMTIGGVTVKVDIIEVIVIVVIGHLVLQLHIIMADSRYDIDTGRTQRRALHTIESCPVAAEIGNVAHLILVIGIGLVT